MKRVQVETGSSADRQSTVRAKFLQVCHVIANILLKPSSWLLSPVLSLHPVAGGGVDVHPGVVLEIFCGAPPAVGPQLHHGGVGPVLQPRCHSGQAHGHVRTVLIGKVQQDTLYFGATTFKCWFKMFFFCVSSQLFEHRPHRGLLQLPAGGKVSDDQALLADIAVLLPAVSLPDSRHPAVCLRLPGLLSPPGFYHGRVWLLAACRTARHRPERPRPGAV